MRSFTYDKQGNTIKEETNIGSNTYEYNCLNQQIKATTKEDNVISRFTRGYDIVSADVENKKYYYNVDEQGSTNFITDKYGKINNEYWYDAFGNILSSKENIHNIYYIGNLLC